MGRGALTFKGESPKKKKSKSKHHAGNPPSAQLAAADGEFTDYSAAAAPVANPSSTSSSAGAPNSKVAPSQSPQMRQGTGHITTSGTVVTGHDTRFMKEMNAGDAIVVNHEMRVVTMRLSDISINLSSAFSQNYATPVSFQYICKARQGPGERAMAEAREKATIEAEHAFDIYKGSGGSSSSKAGPSELVYREKTEHGSYRIKRVKVDGTQVDRGDLLYMRTKKKSDKYC